MGARDDDEPGIEVIDVSVAPVAGGASWEAPPAAPEPARRRPRTRPRLVAVLVGLVVLALAAGAVVLVVRGRDRADTGAGVARRPASRWYLPSAVPAGYQLVAGGRLDATDAGQVWRRVYARVDASGALVAGLRVDTDPTVGEARYGDAADALALGDVSGRPGRFVERPDGRVRLSFVVPDCGMVDLVGVGLTRADLVAAARTARCARAGSSARAADVDAPAETSLRFDGPASPPYAAETTLRYERPDGARVDLWVAAPVPPSVAAFEGASTVERRNGRRVATAPADPAEGTGAFAAAADGGRVTIVAIASGDPGLDLAGLVATTRVTDSLTWQDTVATARAVSRSAVGVAWSRTAPVGSFTYANRAGSDRTTTVVTQRARPISANRPDLSGPATFEVELVATPQTAPSTLGYGPVERVSAGARDVELVARAGGTWRAETVVGSTRVVATLRVGTRAQLLDLLGGLVVTDEITASRTGAVAVLR